MASVGNSSGQATAIGRPAMRGVAVGKSGPNVAISTIAAFTQFRKAGSQVRSAFYGAFRVTRAYYGRVLVARFAFTNTGVGGAATGVATAAAVGNSLATQGRGNSNGVAATNGVSVSQGLMVGLSTDSATVIGVSPGGGAGAGASAGVATASAGGATTPRAFVFADTTDGSIIHITQATSSPNRRTWTLSGWIYLTSLTPGVPAANLADFCGIEVDNNNGADMVYVYDDGTLGIFERSGSADKIDEFATNPNISINTWTHIVLRVDTTSAVGADRIRLYKDGNLITSTALITPAQNYDLTMFQNNLKLAIGGYYDAGFAYASMANNSKIAFVDLVEGQSLAPTDFAFSNSGTWTRKKYAGSYGTHGWSLDGTTGLDTSAGKAYAFTALGDGVTMSGASMPPFTN